MHVLCTYVCVEYVCVRVVYVHVCCVCTCVLCTCMLCMYVCCVCTCVVYVCICVCCVCICVLCAYVCVCECACNGYKSQSFTTSHSEVISVNTITCCNVPSGKILNDASALKEYNISESNFVVVMVSKVRFCPYIKYTVFVAHKEF